VDSDAAADAKDNQIAPLVPGSRFRPDPNVLAKRVDDEIVLVHLETNRIYELNRTAAFLWDALAAGSTRAELEERLALEFDVERDELAREIDELLRQFTSERLIRSG
jgi:Coenzyme PQQ synthesis protein D (PqqD)